MTCLTRRIHDFYFSSIPHLRYYRVPLHCIDQYITADIDTILGQRVLLLCSVSFLSREQNSLVLAAIS
ncbi:hypothetical protein BDR07DRAFT_1432574 [Suillus spraguei]|nr:hypothetical protein BDR07DRAFT_1432574 [Suillus spraguei]